MGTKIKAYCVTHINNNRKDTSVIVATSRYEASKYVEGEVISVGYGSDISIGERLMNIQITQKELKDLQRAKAKLDALEAGGVDNW